MALTDLSKLPECISGAGPIVADTWNGDGSTVYTHGQLLEKLTNGTCIAATADHATNGIHAQYVGPTLTAATSGRIVIRDITEDSRFLVQLHHDTPASAVAAQANVGDQHAIVISGAVWGIDIETALSNNGDVEITDLWDNLFTFDLDNPISNTEQYGLVEVKFLPARLALAPSAA